MERYKALLPDCSIESHKIHLSTLSTVINVLRSALKNKPLKESIKNPDLLKFAFLEAAVGQHEEIKIEDIDKPK